jgi:hypothetical protein
MSQKLKVMSEEQLINDLIQRDYPDVAMTALLCLERVEAQRSKPGYENARHWGHGPHHRELQRLGLAVIGKPQPATMCRPVDLTDLGRKVAKRISEEMDIGGRIVCRLPPA